MKFLDLEEFLALDQFLIFLLLLQPPLQLISLLSSNTNITMVKLFNNLITEPNLSFKQVD